MKKIKSLLIIVVVVISLANCQSAEDKKFLEELGQCRGQQQEYECYKKYNRLDEYNELYGKDN